MEFFNWSMLGSCAGASLAVGVITQITKDVPFIGRIPTQLWSYLLALCTLLLAMVFETGFSAEGALLAVFNAALVSLAANGGYAATCDSTGMNPHSTCSTCGSCFVNGKEVSSSSLSTPALGHSWETVDGKPATCTEDGLKTHEKCTICESLRLEGSSVTEEELLIPAEGHTMEEVAASQATCAEPGIQAHEHCTVCGSLFLNGESVEITQLTTALSSHVLSDWENDAFYHWKACVDCQEIFRQSSHVDKDADGSCDDCGYTLPVNETVEESGFGFSWLFLIPIIAAVAIAVPLAAKKRK